MAISPARARTYTHPIDPILREYSGLAVKAYLWLVTRAGEGDVVTFYSHEILGALSRRDDYRGVIKRVLLELSMGHPGAGPLIEIVTRKHGCGPTKIRIL